MSPAVNAALDSIATALIIIAAPAATMFPIVYWFRPWRQSQIGRALMVKATGMALLIDITIAYYAFGDDYPFRHLVRVIIYGLITLGIWWQFLAMLRAGKREDDHNKRTADGLSGKREVEH